jgi:hypothetical protein
MEIMEKKIKETKKLITLVNEQYQLSRIRRVKLVREIANGTQMRLTKWVF